MTAEIYCEGEPVGRLLREKDGLYTVFSAALPFREGLWRLWLQGSGSYNLGLMEPGEEGLTIRRRLSRAELRKLPEYDRVLLLRAGQCPEENPVSPVNAEAPESPGDDSESQPPIKGARQAGEEKPMALQPPEPETEKSPPAPAAEEKLKAPAEAPPKLSGRGGPLWLPGERGTRYMATESGYLLALPAHPRLRHPRLRFVYIDGEKYTVFRY